RVFLSQSLAGLGREDAARAALEGAVRTAPEDVPARFAFLGWLYSRRSWGDLLACAESLLAAASGQDDDDLTGIAAAARGLTARALWRVGRRDSAIERARAVSPEWAERLAKAPASAPARLLPVRAVMQGVALSQLGRWLREHGLEAF